MVGLGREHSEPPTSARARGLVIPPQNLRRVLVDNMHTPVGASSSAGRGRGKTKRGGAPRGGCGGGRGRKPAVPSSPPPPAVSPDHRSAPSQVDRSYLDPSRTLVHEPRADEPRVSEPSSQETRAPESSSQETRATESSSHKTLETSGHANSEETSWSDDSFSEGELVEQGKKVYPRGGTKLLSVPTTRDQRSLIEPNGEKYVHLLFFLTFVLHVSSS